MNARESLPLAGVRAVEFCQVAAGPFCAMLLADFGAEVIKIEPRDGDGLRQWPPIRNGFSGNFTSLNRGKRSLVLDLKDPADRDVARALVLDADVLVENNRPGVMQRLGLGWDWFGPRAAEGGFDLTIQAAAGAMSVTGEPDGAPVKCGVPLADFTAGLYGAFSIAAMIARVRADQRLRRGAGRPAGAAPRPGAADDDAGRHRHARDDWLPEPFTRPDPQFYRQFLLHADPLERFSVVSFVWGRGQHTPVHDHTVWGLVGMLRGAERCQRYRRAGDGRLVPHGGEEILYPGEVDAVSPTTGDVHVYGGNIGAVRRHVFDPQAGEAKDFVSGYSSEVVPNLWDRSAVVRARIGGG